MRYFTVLFLVFSVGCSISSAPCAVGDAGFVGDAAPPMCAGPDLATYNRQAAMVGCPPAPTCPACPMLINSGFTCDALARALSPCP